MVKLYLYKKYISQEKKKPQHETMTHLILVSVKVFYEATFLDVSETDSEFYIRIHIQKIKVSLK